MIINLNLPENSDASRNHWSEQSRKNSRAKMIFALLAVLITIYTSNVSATNYKLDVINYSPVPISIHSVYYKIDNSSWEQLFIGGTLGIGARKGLSLNPGECTGYGGNTCDGNTTKEPSYSITSITGMCISETRHWKVDASMAGERFTIQSSSDGDSLDQHHNCPHSITFLENMRVVMLSAARDGIIRLENVEQPKSYLHYEANLLTVGSVESGWNSAKWELEPIKTSLSTRPYAYRIKNRHIGANGYLHVEHGPLQIGAQQPGWNSAKWILEYEANTDYKVVRFKNYHTGAYLKFQNNQVVAGPLGSNGRWKILSANLSTPQQNQQVALRSHHDTFLSTSGNNYVFAAPGVYDLGRFTMITHTDDRISFRNFNGFYLSARSNGVVNVVDHVRNFEKFTVTQHAEGKVSLRSHHGTYLGVRADGSVYTGPNDNIWEKFSIIARPMRPPVSLRSHHGTYLAAVGGNVGSQNISNDWEMLTTPENKVALRNYISKSYLSTSHGRASLKSEWAPQGTELFTVITHPEGKISLHTDQGNYLGMRPDGTVYTSPNDDIWEKFQIEDYSNSFARLRDGNVLRVDEAITSPNGRYRLLYQADGNLVLYDTNTNSQTWASGTAGTSQGMVTMQSDGNFVIYDGSNTRVWSSDTDGHFDAWLGLRNDGTLSIYQGQFVKVWTGEVGGL